MDDQATQASFRHMDEGTAEDWAIIGTHFVPFAGQLADRVLTHLKILDGDYGGFPIDRLQHSLQTATRAHRGGELVVARAGRRQGSASDKGRLPNCHRNSLQLTRKDFVVPKTDLRTQEEIAEDINSSASKILNASFLSKAAGWISPVVVAGGRVVGTWHVTEDRLDVEVFAEHGDISASALSREVERVGAVAGIDYTVSVATV